MPVAVKLSQRFYQKFGHELVDELVDWFNQMDAAYRFDLREFNDANFARFDAKLEQRLAEVKSELRQDIGQVRADLRQGVAEVRAEVAAQRGEIIKWMFVFWVGTVATLGGLMFGLLRFLPAAP
jgi:hypothetical protein